MFSFTPIVERTSFLSLCYIQSATALRQIHSISKRQFSFVFPLVASAACTFCVSCARRWNSLLRFPKAKVPSEPVPVVANRCQVCSPSASTGSFALVNKLLFLESDLGLWQVHPR